MKRNATLSHVKNHEEANKKRKVVQNNLKMAASNLNQTPQSSNLHKINLLEEKKTAYYSKDIQGPNLSSESDDDENENQSKTSRKRKLSSDSNTGSLDDNHDGEENAAYQSQNKTRKTSLDPQDSDWKAVNENNSNSEPPVKFSSVVAAFYNSTGSKVESRRSCRIFYLRNFNNWIKSILIDDCLEKLRGNQYYTNIRVLDMCCGKGGDLMKWLGGNVKHVVMTDIAEVSLEQCKKRFAQLKGKFFQSRSFKLEVILADCTRDSLLSKYSDKSIKFDLVSCQFSFHYCFESLPQAECMLKNATDRLKPNGFFIGTLPNANEIVKRLNLKNSTCLSNDIFSLEMLAKKPYALFGAQYKFKLENVVDCPEFLVHFPTFVKLAEKFNLKLVAKKSFPEIYEENKNTEIGYKLLKKMKALETYPPFEKVNLHGPLEDYVHVKEWEKNASQGSKLGTLSRSEWEVITLYDTFVFRKEDIKAEK